MNKIGLFKYGLVVFNGEKDKFRHWLNSPIISLNGRKPCDLLGTTVGLYEVKQILDKIEYGIYS
jgi:putative toxin-antitoxin system antitoxin component (TIGR02293 family)